MKTMATIILTSAGHCGPLCESLRSGRVRVTLDARHAVALSTGSDGYTPVLVDRGAWEDGDWEIYGYSCQRASNAYLVGRANAIELAEKFGLPFVE